MNYHRSNPEIEVLARRMRAEVLKHWIGALWQRIPVLGPRLRHA